VPYEPKILRDARDWMLLSKVVAHIETVDGCDSGTALLEVRAALADEDIPIKWLADVPLPGHYPLQQNLLFALDDPPTGRFFWLTATILPSADYAVLDHAEQFLRIEGDEIQEPSPNISRGLRQLLLRRAEVMTIWPNSRRESDSGKDAQKPSRPSQEAIRIEAQRVYQNEDPKPNLAVAERLIRKALPSANRESIRSVLSEPEFARQRRPAGNSKSNQ
jgi:hypothetical protein